MPITRQQIVDVIKGWKGMKETNGSFKPIIDIYNSINPLPRNCILRYTDDWSCGLISAVYEQAGASHMFPSECNYALMVSKAMDQDVWVENDDYFPKIADVCMFDMLDKGFGDNRGIPDAAGIIVSISRASRTFVVLGCNRNKEIVSRTFSVSGKYIRGFISPVFDEDFIDPPSSEKITTFNVTETPTAEKIGLVSTSNVDNSTPVVGRGVLSKVAAGTELKLNNTPMYASAITTKVSAYKTGAYYLWSVDTVNGRVRITNAKKHVGVSGQVTGWIDAPSAISIVNESNIPTVASISAVSDSISAMESNGDIKVPIYQPNAVYITQVDDLPVYSGPGTRYDYVGYAGLTANAKKYDKNKNGCLCKGVKVTCLDSKIIGTSVWVQIPSGWIAAYYEGMYNIK